MTNLDNVIWGQFKIADLFQLEKCKNKLKKDKLLPYSQELFPVYSSDSGNNGVVGYIKENPSFNLENNKYMVVFGDHTRAINIAKKSFSICDNVKILSNPNNFSLEIALFIITAWKKAIPDLGYNRHWKKASEVDISLPILPTGDPDYDFMEEFIKELEHEQFSELDNHLQTIGLSDTKLTKAEQKALDDFDSLTWGDFKIGNLFEKVKTKKLSYQTRDLPKEPTKTHDLPCLTCSFQNQGLNFYVPREGATILKNVITIPSDSDVYRAYYQSTEFTILHAAYAMEWKDISTKLNREQYLFCVTAINKVTDRPIYSYKQKLGGWNVVKEKFIQLPLDPTDPTKPDFQYMETFIKAIEKLTIKDVVNLKDEQLATTKKVV